ncbi:putative Polycomb group protein ASXL2 isoform X3 [Betta splendens]|uniref:Polycomb group protein ASXL2 isoform X3 n=1 Tax=Betta splendens TaxID=158456 RepID=A0A9W2XJW6_BETSP|nr:putative Polycomb group protein ASXL2 isoform X3 [Betta splendens]
MCGKLGRFELTAVYSKVTSPSGSRDPLQTSTMRERQKKKKGRTWAEAAKTVLEKYPNTPMSHKEILQVIQRERLKEISGTSPLACLNAMLHTNSRGEEGIFYKVPGRMGVYTLKKDISDVAKELSDEGSEESSDDLSDSRSTENSSSDIAQEGRRGRWMRRVSSKLQSQPSSPQHRCSSPSVPTSKLISPSQKHSKKALKQALKQQQQRNQRRQGGMPTSSSPRLLLKTIKDMTDNISTKTAELCRPVVPRKVSPRTSRLSAGQIKRTKCKIDVETPDSILVNTNLRAIINKHTFSVLPPDCQQRLLKLLPEVDRQTCMDGLLKVTGSALNNEFFTSAAQSWKERLAEGEFTPELQLRMRQEIEKEKKVEHWKEAFFENYYGENSGLSYEESKELTKPDQNQESARPKSLSHQTGLAAQARDETKGTKDGNRSESKDIRPAQTSSREPLKAQHAQKEPGPSTEPMKTRRSQYAEDCRLKTTAPSEATPPARTSEAERQTEEVCTDSLPEKDHKEDAKDKKSELTRSPARKNPPPKAGSELKEDQLISVVKPAEECEEVVSEPGGQTEPLKRKCLSETDSEMTPEKRPRVSSVSSESSVSSVSPPASSLSSPSTPTSQRVPPIKIRVSQILPASVASSPVSPRTSLPVPPSSTGRTGARTLADIKAKAQLARAQRVAAAAVSSISKGAVPGPGPGGGTGEQTQPSPSASPTSPQALTKLPTTSSQSSTPPSHTLTTFDHLNPSWSVVSSSRKSDEIQKGHPAVTVSVGNHNVTTHSSAQTPPLHVLKGQENASSSSRTSSCIPANNPLVTQLLQGKEVPLEQILPKPLSKVEVKMPNCPTSSKGKIVHTVEHRANQQISHQYPISTAGRTGALSDYARHHREPPDKETQEQILQALIQRRVQQIQPYGGFVPQHSQYKAHQLIQAEEHQDKPRMSVGFLCRKKMPRPAMTGHYLLNVSTYGRGAESKRLHQSVIPNTGLKRESLEGEEAAREDEPARKVSSPVSGVKMEQQGYSISKSEEAASFQVCSNVKTEPGLEDSAAAADYSSRATAKDTSSFSQSHRRHLELCNSNQGNSEPYFTPADPGHQRPSSFQIPRTPDNQEPAVAPRYGGTINVSVPHAVNHSTAGTGALASATEADASAVHGSVMSFSVTVTTIPAGHSLEHSSQGEPSPNKAFTEGSNMEEVQSKCYCRLKAMIMCKGCGAFCHDDCIGPSKLCVSCLVVR